MTNVADDVVSIAHSWREGLNLDELVIDALKSVDSTSGRVDVVALGKCAPELAAAAHRALVDEPWRTMVITDEDGARDLHVPGLEVEVSIGEHPVPGEGSLRSGRHLIEFLESPTIADATLFLVSGGTSSMCVAPLAPIELADVRTIWRSALIAGFDITELNILRAATSELSAGRVLSHVRTGLSCSLVMVDNVVSGAEWVASGLTFDHPIDTLVLERLLSRLSIDQTLSTRIRAAHRAREAARHHPGWPAHQNLVLVDPRSLLEAVTLRALALGYEVVNLGELSATVSDVASDFTAALGRDGAPRCVIGVGEVSVAVTGAGRGGRCQEFAWHLAREIDGLNAAAAAVATDGRDHVRGIAGAWCSGETLARARSLEIDWDHVASDNDTNAALRDLSLTIPGGRTGWNLCDVYVACRR